MTRQVSAENVVDEHPIEVFKTRRMHYPKLDLTSNISHRLTLLLLAFSHATHIHRGQEYVNTTNE
jgi:hypothetical protein